MVSSTIKGLDAERRAIKDALENQKIYPNLFKVHLSEDWTSDDRSSKELCLKLARECNLFILLLGTHYGNPPRGTSTSVTEMEFKAARANDPRKIRAYLKKVQTVAIGAKQRRFIEKIRDFYTGMQCPQFHSLAKLREFVVDDALTFLLSQSRVNSTQLSQTYVPSPETSRRSHRLLETLDEI